MGMDVFIEPEFSKRSKQFEPDFIEAVKKRDNAKTKKEEKQMQKEVYRIFYEMHRKYYFRTPYNSYGLQHWLQANIGEGYKNWGLSIFDIDKDEVTDVEDIKEMLRIVNEWIEKTADLKTSVLWVDEFCKDYKKKGIKEVVTRIDNTEIKQKLVRLYKKDTNYYKEWLNELKEFLEDAVRLVANGSKLVIS